MDIDDYTDIVILLVVLALSASLAVSSLSDIRKNVYSTCYTDKTAPEAQVERTDYDELYMNVSDLYLSLALTNELSTPIPVQLNNLPMVLVDSTFYQNFTANITNLYYTQFSTIGLRTPIKHVSYDVDMRRWLYTTY